MLGNLNIFKVNYLFILVTSVSSLVGSPLFFHFDPAELIIYYLQVPNLLFMCILDFSKT